MSSTPNTPESSQASTPAPADSPLMKAWEAYKATPQYANSRKWALLAKAGEQNERDVDGSLWAAFSMGFLHTHHNQTPVVRSESAPIREIAAERQRQVEVEGWDAAHDDGHAEGQLAAAAACFAVSLPLYDEQGRGIWQWDWQWWKPKNPRRDLVRAAALIVAEIERIDRRAK